MALMESDVKKNEIKSAELRIAIDQHGTYKIPRRGGVIHITQQITDSEAEMLLDPSTDWDDLSRRFISVSGGLSKESGITPRLISFKSFVRAVPGILGYKVDERQQYGLNCISHEGLAMTTLVSAMPHELADWAWLMLGRKGRESLDPDLQMILNRGRDRLMLSKLVSIGYLVHKIDKPSEIRQEFKRRVILVDDDLNVLRNASRIYQIQGFGLEGKSTPDLQIPGPLQSMPEEICIGAGLPEVYKLLLAERENNRHEPDNLSLPQVADIIISDSSASFGKQRLY